VKGNLPAVLIETAGERFFERIPSTYLTRVIVSVLARHIVYREGLDWFEQMLEWAIAKLAIRYFREENNIRRLVEQIKRSA
jgi:glutamate dehydrogenase